MYMKFAQIALLNQSRYTDQLYTYLIPDTLAGHVKLGSRVIVPFGRGNKPFEGFVMNLLSQCEYPKAKAILDLPDQEIALSEKQIELCNWLISDCYCTISEALQLMVPTGATFKRLKKVVIVDETEDQWPMEEPLLTKIKNEKPIRSDLSEEEEKRVKSQKSL